MIKFRAMISSAKIQYYSSMGRSMFKFCVIVQPILMGLFLGMIYMNSSDLDFTTYALIGSGISTFWSSICFSSASDIQRERWYGTLENIYVAPIGFTWIIFGKIIGNSIAGVLSILISFTTVFIVYGRPLVVEYPFYFIMSILMLIMCFMVVGFFMASFFTLSRNSRILMNFLEYPIFILCGFLFPIDLLPEYLQWFSYILAPTWAMKCIRFSVTGKGSIWSLVILVAITGALFLLAQLVYKEIDKKCRIDATLGVY
ncbi:MAG: ABC transporter permease [Peptoniphilaceae bacterium]|uniref:ABC transporter permease n=1 Tax=Parvimonas sp. TaxID=1944660 RepID=UPI0025FFAD9E|nr:ABC transporter permease [Parvimonas sp.]MCI5997023.1 ABC transporter permease [Parvimonas sp.]MDD7764331.1 ABC transporter permease [Peptoniphilaceae bacterium]MDY3050083.1 ABC transporter permease [Parvimonas sp.]